MVDTNSVIAGCLRDLAFAHESTRSRWGYKRAAAAIFNLADPIELLVQPDGALARIANVGPASTRVILEVLEHGRSPLVDRAVEESGNRADILRRRGLRSNFLSRAVVTQVLAASQPNAPSLADYRADFQMHSDWSDGSQTLDEIVATGIARGYTHAAVTDHSYGLPIAGGLSMGRVAEQHRAINELNARHRGRFQLLKGIEANIRADGSVDMTRDELALMELVVAAPHSGLRSTADQTQRMIRAVRTPGVHILGHPRGRMYGSRAGVQADWKLVFEASAEAGVAVELDGDPSRQDLDYELARLAIASGCLFAIDSDAHGPGQWANSEFGLAHARLADVPPDRVVNGWPLDRLLAWAEHRVAAA